jgi:hypothetical protein
MAASTTRAGRAGSANGGHEIDSPPTDQPAGRNLPAAVQDQTVFDHPTMGLQIYDVLTEWRAAEREVGALSEDSPGWAHVQAMLVELRALHRGLFDEHVRRWPSS